MFTNSDREWLFIHMPEHTQDELEKFVAILADNNDDFTTLMKLEESRKQALFELKRGNQ